MIPLIWIAGGGNHVSVIALEPPGVPKRDSGGPDGAVYICMFVCVIQLGWV